MVAKETNPIDDCSRLLCNIVGGKTKEDKKLKKKDKRQKTKTKTKDKRQKTKDKRQKTKTKKKDKARQDET